MIDVTVKTMDSQNHLFSIEEELTVKEFKEVISPTVNIPVDEQRLIFRGRVLQDDKKIKDYNVANNTVHLLASPNQPIGGGQNDESPRNARVGEQTRTNVPIGSGIPSRSRNSAAVRLKIANDMLSKASNLLERLEEDDQIAAATRQSATSNSSTSEESQEHMEIVATDDPNTLSQVMSQVANATAVFVSVHTIHGGSDGSDDDDTVTFEGPQDPPVTMRMDEEVTSSSNSSAPPPQESPRLREMAIALQDVMAIHSRLTPFLKYVQNILRENPSFSSETGQLQSVQYVYDTVTAILHCLGHSYHAYSDAVCDFSISPENRRISTPGTNLGSDQIPVTVLPVSFGANPQGTQSASQSFSSSSSSSTTQNVPHPQPQPTTTLPPGLSGLPPGLSGLPPGLSGLPPGLSGLPPGLSGLPPGLSGLPPGLSGLPPGLSGLPPGLSGLPPGLSGLPPGLSGLPPGLSGLPPGLSGLNFNSQIPSGITVNADANAAGNVNNPFANLQQSIRNHMMRPSFDILLPCQSHHTNRNRLRERPADLHQHVNISRESTNADYEESNDFFETLIELIRCSTWLEILHPYLKDIVQNYLMRGRDSTNSQHIKTCSRSLSKTHLPFFQRLADRIVVKNEKVAYENTITEFLSRFLFKLLHTTLTTGPTSFHTAVLSSFQEGLSQLLDIFRHCFPNNNRVPEIFANLIVENFFVGTSIVFQKSATSSLEKYFVAFSSSAEKNNVDAQTAGLIFKSDEDLIDEEISASVSLNMSKLSTTQSSKGTTSAATNLVSSAPKKVVPFTGDTLESDIDDLVASPPPFQAEEPKNESPLRHIPPEWRDTVQHDMRRQLGMSDPAPPSRGFYALFPSRRD